MTRRILLTLADDTTDTGCGACEAKRLGSDSAWWCNHFGGMLSDTCDDVAQRDEACIAAEAAAARMVEIAPEDALELCDTMLRHDFDMRLHHPAAQRAGIAIDTHADKARGKVQP